MGSVSVPSIIPYPIWNANRTGRFQRNASLLNTPSVSSKDSASSRNAIAIVGNVLLFAFPSSLAFATLIVSLNFAKSLVSWQKPKPVELC